MKTIVNDATPELKKTKIYKELMEEAKRTPLELVANNGKAKTLDSHDKKWKGVPLAWYYRK